MMSQIDHILYATDMSESSIHSAVPLVSKRCTSMAIHGEACWRLSTWRRTRRGSCR